ncbi:MAG: FKBP-type peptidyl-prolyl cis-trans isomerase [Thermodesulfobacteriota bacterium]
MRPAQKNDTVTVCFEGRTVDGELFESATPDKPLRFTIGDEAVLAVFSDAIVGMRPGEQKMIVVEPADAFGERQEELVVTIDRTALPASITPRPGLVVGMTVRHNDADHRVPALITAVSETSVTLDYNHPLAGKIVSYAITLRTVEEPAAN